MKINKSLFLLLLILFLLSVSLRLPGIFWGYHLFGNVNVGFNTDEGIFAFQADEFLTLNPDKYNIPYIKGFSSQIAVLALPLKIIFQKISVPILVGVGRGLSLIYGSLTVILIFFLTYELFRKKEIAFFAALFLCLSGLHISYSHLGKPDVGSVFWIYLGFYAIFFFFKKKDPFYLLIASVAAGAAIAMKYTMIVLIPLLYVFFESKGKRIFNSLLIGLVIIGTFVLFNGFSFGLDDMVSSFDVIKIGAINSRIYNKLINPLMYFFIAIPAVGLFTFLLSLYGLFKIKKDKRIIIIISTLLIYILQISIGDITRTRFFLPVIPFLAICAGYGLFNLKTKLKKAFNILLLIIILYQIIYVVSFEYNYVYETRGDLAKWMLENIDKDKLISIGDQNYKYIEGSEKKVVEKGNNIKKRDMVPNSQGIIIPPIYNTTSIYEGDFLVLYERYISRYISSQENPFYEPECCKEVWHCKYEDCLFIQKLNKGKAPFKLVKTFKTKDITPELILFKYLFNTYQDFGDVYVYRRIKK